MARVLDSFPSAADSGRYPWDEWLDGQVRELIAGEDFTVGVEAFRRAAYTAAKERQLKIRSKAMGDNSIALVASPREDEDGDGQ
jgi:hypothetical protein